MPRCAALGLHITFTTSWQPDSDTHKGFFHLQPPNAQVEISSPISFHSLLTYFCNLFLCLVQLTKSGLSFCMVCMTTSAPCALGGVQTPSVSAISHLHMHWSQCDWYNYTVKGGLENTMVQECWCALCLATYMMLMLQRILTTWHGLSGGASGGHLGGRLKGPSLCWWSSSFSLLEAHQNEAPSHVAGIWNDCWY